MTKSTITREQLIKKAQEQIEFCRHTKITGEGRAHVNQCAALFEIALAAMDSEPVIVVGDDGGDALSYRRLIQSFEPGTKLYRHAQTAPVVPEGKPIPNTLSMYAVDAVATIAEVKGWNACRAAMMQELKKSAGTEAICRSDENVQVLHTKSPAQSDCCPAQNVVVPAQSPIDHGYLPECECSGCKATARICTEMAVNSLVIPNEMTSEQAYEIGYYYGDPVNVFARGANWMRQHIIDSTLAAAPQLPGSEPATVPGKWIPVSERMPEDRTQVILWDAEIGEVTSGHYSHKTQTFYHCGDAIENEITHWMAPPAAPQEVRGE
ncbi:DUF551 domain-containing protein [Klebsiella sp. K4-74]|nr:MULTISPECIES: DUF551 domain-containing protein [Klebsiella]MCS5912551.1 DUF551 domain-containing protein [Klebsiella pneumoniae subsp. pneumoniae]MDK1920742.1 DUF551 domain-containing protein [Klebsiella sp. K4-74]